jgi:hypothetical protein
MFDFLLVARAIGVIDEYFQEESIEEDFWEINRETYPNLEEEFCFLINPNKLKDKYIKSAEGLIVTEEEKEAILAAFKLIHEYSGSLSESACLSERLLFAKKLLPSAFFCKESYRNRCKIVPLT